MKIALLGVQGQIGNHLALHLATQPQHLVWGPCREELNLYDPSLVYDKICKAAPDLIINAAAYNNVDGAETHTELADKVNHQAVREIAKAAKNLDIPLIHFSTDYVFGGEKEEKYKEEDATQPLSQYGKTKLDGDLVISALAPKGIIFRTSWVYSWRRTNFFLTMKSLMQPGAKLHIVDDQFGVPNSAKLLAQKVYEYVQQNNFKSMSIVNLVCNDYTSWYQFAKVIRSYLHKDPWVQITPISTEQYLGKFAKGKVIAMRPKNVVLDNSKAASMGINMPKWNVEFADFIQKPPK